MTIKCVSNLLVFLPKLSSVCVQHYWFMRSIIDTKISVSADTNKLIAHTDDVCFFFFGIFDTSSVISYSFYGQSTLITGSVRFFAHPFYCWISKFIGKIKGILHNHLMLWLFLWQLLVLRIGLPFKEWKRSIRFGVCKMKSRNWFI